MISSKENARELLGLDKVNQVEYVAISVASPDAIRSWSKGEVKNPETINYRTFKPEKGGLFCERIFGPVKDWECSCGKYKRIKHRGVVCDRCGVEVTLARVRRERMGHIELAVPVCHIWFFKCMPSRIGLALDMTARNLERVIYYEDYMVIDPGSTPLKQNQLLSEHEYREARETYGAEAFLDGIPLGEMNTSMTINATAAWLLALYIVVAEEQGVDSKALQGTTQNDILKEYLSRGTYIFPPEASKRLTADVIAYTVKHAPGWNPINVCPYHLQEAGATPVQELAYGLANAIAVLDAVRDSGQVAPEDFPEVVGRISFFVDAGVRFVEEMCKMRAFTQMWDDICRERYGVMISGGQAAGNLVRIGHMGPTARSLFPVVGLTAVGRTMIDLGAQVDVGAGAEAAPGPSVRPEGSVKTLLDAAASALTRANEELRRLDELLRRLREAGGR
jgi:hypothetical protein